MTTRAVGSCVTVVVLVLGFAGCATTTLPSKAAFSEHVLAPLAEKDAADMIEARKAEAAYATAKWKREHPQTNNSPSSLLAILAQGIGHAFAPGIGGVIVGDLLNHALTHHDVGEDPDATLAETVAHLDLRRPEVTLKLLSLYESRVQEQDGKKVFAFCHKGKEQRHAREAGFPRLEDGARTCPLQNVWGP